MFVFKNDKQNVSFSHSIFSLVLFAENLLFSESKATLGVAKKLAQKALHLFHFSTALSHFLNLLFLLVVSVFIFYFFFPPFEFYSVYSILFMDIIPHKSLGEAVLFLGPVCHMALYICIFFSPFNLKLKSS